MQNTLTNCSPAVLNCLPLGSFSSLFAPGHQGSYLRDGDYWVSCIICGSFSSQMEFA